MNPSDTRPSGPTTPAPGGPLPAAQSVAPPPVVSPSVPARPDAPANEAPLAPPPAARTKPEMRNQIIFGLAVIGLLAGLVAAYLFGIERKPQPPAFAPISSPYDTAIYANGIIESDQASGSNINFYPEVSGPVTAVFVHEGQQVAAGTPLLAIDDTVQKATTE